MTDARISQNIAKLRERIRIAAEKCGRSPGDVTLLAVSKTRGPDEIRLAADCGLTQFGENYLQEAVPKIEALTDLPLCWHFIGPIQSNKTRDIAAHFDWVHSVDRLKVARRLSNQRPAGADPMNVCLQVNISDEASKSGVAPDSVAGLAAEVATLPGLRLRGLMAIPVATDDDARQRAAFSALRDLQQALRSKHPGLDTLSMGMSGDLEAAIAEGATTVRVGTAIFGERPG